ncbi:type VI secretion system amidase effector protein Tae4 [Paludisphaera soli]|uniref:type VI secretion system amidase effector protein Tae4 n=1 Tax=Paludisphaera soli TaxID=2712865 RepID=UPI0013EB28CE|nr:type VI secretion system amidase effector protein Tae4 [Paludisphaera soli]
MLMFRTLWSVHPSNYGDDAPCRDKKGNSAFENQCAIRMGVALADAGMDLSSFRGARCWHGHRHVLRVEELIKWLKTRTADVGTARSFKPGADARAAVAGVTGIVACRNFWGRGNQGDHIDVWDGAQMAHGDPGYMDRSEEVVFWTIA